MKVNYSLEPLNRSFKRIQSNPLGYDPGSITPRTATNKVICDEVKISQEALEKYNESKLLSIKKVVIQLENDVKQNIQKIEPLEMLVSIDKSYDKNLQETKLKIGATKDQIYFLEKSSAIQIKHDSGFSFETIYQEGIRENHGIINAATPAVIRYGLDTESEVLNSLVGSYIEKGVLHPYEEVLFQRAFDYLKQVESADYYIKSGDKSEYPNNVVLVDIFDRSKGFVNAGHNQTHTIALWKKKDNEFVLIDPSNVGFSDHLGKSLSSLLKVGISLSSITGGTIYGSGGKETGYSKYADVLPKPRDCVDIAVKVAFELNEQQKSQIDLVKVEFDMLQQVSNQTVVAPHMNLVKDINVRTLQSTSKQVRAIALYTLQQSLYIAPKKK